MEKVDSFEEHIDGIDTGLGRAEVRAVAHVLDELQAAVR
jgi:hypothetical protein